MKNVILGALLLLSGTLLANTTANAPGWWNPANLEQAFLGIRSNEITKEKAQKLGFDNPHGSYVTSVIQNTAADKAGIQPFDYIFQVNDEETTGSKDLGDLLSQYESGQQVTIGLIRRQKLMRMEVVLSSRNDAVFEPREPGQKAFLGVIDSYGRSGSGKYEGVPVNISSNSTAEAIGLQDGDVITGINGYPILDWDDISTAIGMLTPGETIRVTYERDGEAATAKGTIRSFRETKSSSARVRVQEAPEAEKAFLGIYLEDISEKKREYMGIDNPYGAFVSGVVPGSGAEKAGIQSLDYIYGVDQYRVGQNQKLGSILAKYKAGDQAAIHLIRARKPKIVEVVFVPRSQTDKKEKRNKCEDPFLGITEGPDNPKLGVSIGTVENSTAEALGLEKGDLITSINGIPVADWDDIGYVLDMLSPGQSIQVGYERNGNTQQASSTLKSYAETKECEDCDCDELGMDFDFDIDFDFDFDWEEEEMAEYQATNMEVQIQELPRAEARALNQRHDIDLPTESSLKVDNMSLKAMEEGNDFELKFDVADAGDTLVKVHNDAGRQIYKYELGDFSGTFTDQLNLAENGPGIYYLTISQGGKSLVRKLIVTGS